MLFSSRNHAIGMAHYQIAGGNKALLIILGGYVALAVSVLGLIIHNTRAIERSDALHAVAVFLLVAETFGLVFFGSGRVANCIRVDTVTGMIESHRLMPIPAPRAVVSYLFGTTAQLLILLVVNALVLAGVEAAVHVPLDQFITSQMVLAFFALFAWTLIAMSAFMFRQALPLMIVAFIFGGMTTAFLREVGILPAVSILASPFLGETIYNITGGSFSLREVYFIAIPGQVAFSVLFFIGACRRYRGNYLTTFNVGMGIALVALWGGLSLLSIRAWPHVLEQFGWRMGDQPDVNAQIVAGLVVAALLTLVPLHALATWEGARGLRPWALEGALGAIVAAALLVAAMGADPAAVALSACVVLLHAVTCFAAFRFTRGMSPLAAGVLVIGLLIALWVGPFVLEVVRLIVDPPSGSGEDFSVISTLSPVGLLMRAWGTAETMPPAAPGLTFQAFVAAFAWVVGKRRAARIGRLVMVR